MGYFDHEDNSMGALTEFLGNKVTLMQGLVGEKLGMIAQAAIVSSTARVSSTAMVSSTAIVSSTATVSSTAIVSSTAMVSLPVAMVSVRTASTLLV